MVVMRRVSFLSLLFMFFVVVTCLPCPKDPPSERKQWRMPLPHGLQSNFPASKFKFPAFEDKNLGNPAAFPGYGYINAAQSPFNATGNGVTDDTNAIQNALNYASSQGGGIVYLPPGNYLLTNFIALGVGVTLMGSARSPQGCFYNQFGCYGNGTTVVGTTLLATSQTVPAIILNAPGSGVEGINVFYPYQTETNPPIPYPPTIQGRAESVFIKNTFLVNPWFGVDFATFSCNRHFISGLYGQPLDVGIQVDQCYDIGRIEHVHFIPFWTVNADVLNYIQYNAFSFIFERSDWEVVHNVFSYMYHTGMTFTASAYGATNGQFSDIDFDGVDVGLDIYTADPYGLQFSNLNLANIGAGSSRVGIWGHPGGARVIISTVSIWGNFNYPVLWQNNDYLSLSNGNFVSWNGSNPAITLQLGRASISNSYFEDTVGTAISIASTTDRVMIVGNELVGNQLVNANPNAVIAANNY